MVCQRILDNAMQTWSPDLTVSHKVSLMINKEEGYVLIPETGKVNSQQKKRDIANKRRGVCAYT